jgi:hypothetical protein
VRLVSRPAEEHAQEDDAKDIPASEAEAGHKGLSGLVIHVDLPAPNQPRDGEPRAAGLAAVAAEFMSEPARARALATHADAIIVADTKGHGYVLVTVTPDAMSRRP